MQLGWQAAATALLGAACGLLASSVTVWLLVRRGSPARVFGVPVVPPGLVARVFASAEFRRNLSNALLASSAVQARLTSAIRDQVAALGARTVGDLAPAPVQQRLLSRLQGALQGPGAERMLRQGTRAVFDRVQTFGVPLRRLLPWDFSPVIAAAVERATPILIAQLGAVLRERETRIQLHVALRGMVDRFLGEQEGWKRTIGAFLLTDRALAHLVERISTTGFEALSGTLRDPATQQRIVKALNESLRRALERSPRDLMAGLAPEQVQALPEKTADRLLRLVRDPDGHERMAAALRAGFSRVENVPVAHLVGLRSAENVDRLADKLSGCIAAALRSDTANTASPGQVIVAAVRPHLAGIVAAGACAAGALALFASLAFNWG